MLNKEKIIHKVYEDLCRTAPNFDCVKAATELEKRGFRRVSGFFKDDNGKYNPHEWNRDEFNGKIIDLANKFDGRSGVLIIGPFHPLWERYKPIGSLDFSTNPPTVKRFY